MAPELNKPFSFDERRDLFVGSDEAKTVHFCVDHFLECAKEAIKARGVFRVALSGGHTPAKIFNQLLLPSRREAIDYSRVELFWSDERNVPPDSPESNYRMAMESAFSKLPIASEKVFRIKGEKSAFDAANAYNALLIEKVPLDLVMLGMGDDGHTASLFPYTKGLLEQEHLVIANEVPQKQTWRITLSFKGIHSTRQIAVYLLGKSKCPALKEVLLGPFDPERLPSQRVGTPSCRALWITDQPIVIDWIKTRA